MSTIIPEPHDPERRLSAEEVAGFKQILQEHPCPDWCCGEADEHAAELLLPVPRHPTHRHVLDEGPTEALAVRIDTAEAIDPGAASWGPAIVVGPDPVSPEQVRELIEDLTEALKDLEWFTS